MGPSIIRDGAWEVYVELDQRSPASRLRRCASKKALHLCGDVEEPRLILSFQSEYRFRWFCLRKSSFCCRRVSSMKLWSRRGITWNRVATVQAWMSPDAR